MVAQPPWQSCVALLLVGIVFSTVSLVASVQAAGKARSFWVGASIPCAIALLTTFLVPLWFFEFAQFGFEFRGTPNALHLLQYADMGFWCFAPINGLLAVGIHSLFWPRQGQPGHLSENPISK
ncbi:MAG TPA: hypothetical protein VHC22_28590 [Pirellulales bacterium]|nr:hypothetical protein [Pirellulales bacterium]